MVIQAANKRTTKAEQHALNVQKTNLKIQNYAWLKKGNLIGIAVDRQYMGQNPTVSNAKKQEKKPRKSHKPKAMITEDQVGLEDGEIIIIVGRTIIKIIINILIIVAEGDGEVVIMIITIMPEAEEEEVD